MGFHAAAFRVSQIKSRALFMVQLSTSSSRSFSRKPQLSNHRKRPSFGIAFDIDGVILRGRLPIGGSPQALRRLYGDSASRNLEVPFLFLTNGGGIPESRRAIELTELLNVEIRPAQLLPFPDVGCARSFTFQKLVEELFTCQYSAEGFLPSTAIVMIFRFENELIVATGKGDPALVMSEYGFKKVVSLDEYASYFEKIDPVSQYKTWKTKLVLHGNSHSGSAERVKAAFVVSDPVDWGRDIQVLCDILRSGGLPGQANGQQPPLYFAADDLEYQAAFPSKRLGMGAFRIALESIFNRINHKALEYVTFGKPNPFVFKNAEAILSKLQASCYVNHLDDDRSSMSNSFKTLYIIGDNPAVDIKGAKQAGHPWFSILTRTGVFQGEDNHAEFPADLVVNTVEEAVEYILERESIS